MFKLSNRAQSEQLALGLGADIHKTWARLLNLHAGTVLPEPSLDGRSHFDYAMCVVAFAELRCRVIRGRGETRVQVASVLPPENWDELTMVLLACSGKYPTDINTYGLPELEDVLIDHWVVLHRYYKNLLLDSLPH